MIDNTIGLCNNSPKSNNNGANQMTQFRAVEVKLTVYVPYEIAQDTTKTLDYLNDKLHTDPEFYGEIDLGCINITNETF